MYCQPRCRWRDAARHRDRAGENARQRAYYQRHLERLRREGRAKARRQRAAQSRDDLARKAARGRRYYWQHRARILRLRHARRTAAPGRE